MHVDLRSAVLGALGGIGIALASGAASAVTIGFEDGTLSGGTYSEDGFLFTPASLSNGGCPGDAPCLLQNNGAFQAVTMTAEGGGAFTLEGFSYHFIGDTVQQRGVLTLTDGTTQTFTQADFGNDPFTIDFGDEFADVSAITFSHSGNGSGRLDDVIASLSNVSPIPLPASILMLIGAIGGLGLLGARRRAGMA